MENLPLPNEIVLQILGYLSLGEIIQCARVSKRLNSICKDNSLSYSSLIARPDVKEAKSHQSIGKIIIKEEFMCQIFGILLDYSKKLW